MTIHIGNHAIAHTKDGYLAYRQSAWYVGKYNTLAVAKLALDNPNIKGVFAQVGTIPMEETWFGIAEVETCSDYERDTMQLIADGTHHWVKTDFGYRLEPVAGVPFAAYETGNAIIASM
jgi:hypothetical protein